MSTAAEQQDEAPPRLRILWTTMGPFPQPLVGITVQGEFMDTERAELLESVAEFVAAGRKRRGDEVESTIRGSNVEDYVQIKAAAVHWPKPKPGNICAPPAIVRWLLKALPAILPSGCRSRSCGCRRGIVNWSAWSRDRPYCLKPRSLLGTGLQKCKDHAMPTIETLILRRSYPVPVTFADLRRAFSDSFIDGDGGQLQTCRAEMERAIHRADRRPNAAKNARHVLASIHRDWVSAIKEATGATDDIYALIDGHEVRVGTVTGSGESATANIFGCISAGQAASLLIAADEAGYWERPHEVRVVLQERPVSVAAVERAVNVGWTAKGGAA